MELMFNMKGNWKKAKEVSEEDFPEPKATKQYSKPIGPEKPVSKQTHYRKVSGVDDDELEFPEPKATTQYKKPIGPEKPTPIPSKKKTISTGGLPFASVGKNFSDLQQQMGPPTWMNQSGGKRGKVSAPRAFGNVPGWVMGGRAPWDSSPKSGHKDIVRTIITKVHEDGTKTRTVRGPPAPKKGSNKPNWISW